MRPWTCRSFRRRSAAARVLLAVASIAVAIHAIAPSTRADTTMTLVLCAPGYPGTTAEAQPALDALAAAVTAGADGKPGELKAVYFETEKGGLDRLSAADAALALVPLPFWLKHRATLRLDPQLQAVQQGGEPLESWTLVAATGSITTPASLAGWELVSLAGYAPRFVRGAALGQWGELPANVTITFSSSVLTALRRASSGNKVAVLLDREQAAALPTLPFASKLQVVARSAPLPVSMLCVVGGRLDPVRLKSLTRGFLALNRTKAGAEALAAVRMTRFLPVDQAALARARDAFDRAKE